MNPSSSRPTAVTACWVSVVPIRGNAEWVNPHEPDAQITKMKDGQTHLAHKQEQAVDLDTGAVLAVTLAGGTAHHTQTLGPTLAAANTTLQVVRAQVDASTAAGVAAQVANAVADKGYHSNAVMLALATAGVRSYIAEPERGRRCWAGKPAERDAVYRNRRRIRGGHGKALLRSRGELLERPFAHALETGGMRRTHLRRHENILKRLLIHLGGLNLGLLMRTRFGIGTPRGLQGRADRLAAFLPALWRLWDAVVAAWVRFSRPRPPSTPSRRRGMARQRSRRPAVPTSPSWFSPRAARSRTTTAGAGPRAAILRLSALTR
jgi:transposase